jgi:DNA-binding NarL/FixJ family response regulator
MAAKLKVAIAEDQHLFRKGFISLLEDIENVKLTIEADNGKELLDALEKNKENLPDIIFMDIQMPVMDGIEATEIISVKYPSIKILALTMFNSDEFILQMHRKGAHGFLSKETEMDEVLDAIDMVIHKGKFYNDHTAQVLLENAEKVLKSTSRTGVYSQLTQRELEIIRLICSEQSNMEIADELNLSVRTVEWHRRNLLSKLNIKTPVGLTKYAMENGII